MSNYKFSFYNEIFSENDSVYIYNYITGGLGELDDTTAKTYVACKGDEDLFLEEILQNSELKKMFIDGGMIIDKNLNELEYLKFLHYSNRFANNNCFTLTLLPTNACNCRCAYCFEKEYNYKNGLMSEKVQNEVINLVDKNLHENGKLELMWFGGEPLIGIDVIREIHRKLRLLKEKKNIYISSGMVSNGVLLTPQISKELVEIGISKIQITLDGPKRIHDTRRKLQNGKGTFDDIVKNISDADKKLEITVRVNVDKQNFEFMEELLEELVSKGLNEMENISLYFGMVKDYSGGSYNCNIYYSTKEYAEKENKLHALAEQKGFLVDLLPRENIVNCGALFPNTLVVEADGTLQKCWNTVGDKTKSIGNLLENEENMANPNLMKWLGWNPLEKEKCLGCKKLPLCFGGCPYFSIYNSDEYYMYECNPIALNSLDRIKTVARTGSK